MPEIYAVLAYGPEKEKLLTALQTAIVKAEEHNVSITLVVPALRYAASTILSDVIGENLVKALVKKKSVTLNGVEVIMQSMQTYTPYSQSGVVVALWGGDKMLEKLDQTISAKVGKSIVVLSWNDAEVEPWCKQNEAVIVEV